MKKDDKGFTLLELLIAVIILAFIIVPLLRSFVTSYNVNARSRRMMRATTLAQNEMEIFEKEKLEVLLDDTEDAKYDYDVDMSVVTSDPDTADAMDHVKYTFKREGIINYDADDDDPIREMFDVVVTLDPESTLDSDLYYPQNTQDLLFMNTISGSDSASYAQRIRNVVNTEGEDEAVYKWYETQQVPEGITSTRWTVEQFAEELTRTITVKIEQEDQGGFVTTVAKVKYDYYCGNGIVPDEYKNYPSKDKVIFNNSQLLDEDGKPIDLKSVYLFYAPRYYKDASGTVIKFKDDNIVIENKDNLPVNIYIIRQNILDDMNNTLGKYTDNVLGPQNTVPVDYKVFLEIHEGLDETKTYTYGNYFTNLNLGLPDADERGTTYVTLYDTDGMIYTDNVATEKAKFKSLGSTEAKDRIYTMEVSVYNHGDDPETDEPLVTLTGSKIE